MIINNKFYKIKILRKLKHKKALIKITLHKKAEKKQKVKLKNKKI